nr:Gag-Pol polyprotein [Tanacetum cinerariifolium]
MTTPTVTSTTDSQMHNNIMAPGSRDHPLMLATGRHPQWRSRKCEKLSKGYNKVNPSTFKMSRQTYFGKSPEWSRFVTILKQQHKLNEVSFHKLFDILKQYQKEVNELHAERLARNANPLAVVATAQANQYPYYQISKSQKSYTPSSKPLIPTRSHTTTRYKGKEIAKSITPPSESASKEDNDPKQAYAEEFGSHCKEFGHFTKECRKPKRVKDYAYHKEKMLLCKQAEKCVSLQAEQYDWLVDTDEEIDEHELEAHYNYIEKIQDVPTADLGTDSEPLEQTNAQRIPKPSVLGKPAPFSDSLKRKHFSKTKSVPKTNVSEGLLKIITAQTLPQTARQANFECECCCATYGKCLVDSDDFACVTKMLNDVNARTKKANVVPISTRKPKGHANKSFATPHKKKIASKSTTQKPKSYYRMLYEKTSKACKWWIEQQCPSGYKWVHKTKMQWVPKARNENVQKRVSFAIDNASRITNVL